MRTVSNYTNDYYSIELRNPYYFPNKNYDIEHFAIQFYTVKYSTLVASTIQPLLDEG